MKYTASVIVIAYNHAESIASCLYSVIENTEPENTQLIIYDDCSTDNTRQVITECLEYWDGETKCIFPETNRRSTGAVVIPELVSIAEGDSIFLIEGDDFWTTCGKKRVPAMAQELRMNDDLAFTFTDTLKIDTINNKTSFLLSEPLKGDVSRENLKKVNYSYIHMGACCFRNAALKFPDEFYVSTCKDIWLPMLWSEYGDARYMGQLGSLVYRFNGKGVWSGCNQAEKETRKLILGYQLMSYFLKRNDLAAIRANAWRISRPKQALFDDSKNAH